LPIIDSEGNMLVLDSGYFRIQKYDKEGKYLRTIGRQGQGPGEFERPSNLYLDNQDNLYVMDSRHIDVFDKNGTFQRTFKTTGYESHLGVMAGGNIFAQIKTLESFIKGTDEITLISSEGEKNKTIVSFPLEYPPPINGAAIVSKFGHPGLSACFLNEEFGVYGYSSEYKLFMANSLGEIAYTIDKDEKGEIFTKKEKSELIDREMKQINQSGFVKDISRRKYQSVRKMPKYKPFFSSIIKDDKDRIYVRRFKLPTDEDETPVFDVFNIEGYYLYKIKIPLYRTPFNQNSIQNGYVYVREYDFDLGYHYIKRYKIKNWEQIRE
jgi:hypothetical protein